METIIMVITGLGLVIFLAVSVLAIRKIIAAE